jgi:hypothetical protein
VDLPFLYREQVDRLCLYLQGARTRDMSVQGASRSDTFVPEASRPKMSVLEPCRPVFTPRGPVPFAWQDKKCGLDQEFRGRQRGQILPMIADLELHLPILAYSRPLLFRSGTWLCHFLSLSWKRISIVYWLLVKLWVSYIHTNKTGKIRPFHRYKRFVGVSGRAHLQNSSLPEDVHSHCY